MDRSAARTRALVERRHLDAVVEPDERPVKQQCNHFSIREYVAVLQKKDPKLYSLSQNFCKQQRQDEQQNLRPVSVTKFRRWNCSSCLDKANSANRTTSITVSPKQNGTDSGCSISFVRTVRPTSVHHTRVLTCTQRSSQVNEGVGSVVPKSTQECNSKCNSPSGNKGVLTELNVIDQATKESSLESPNNLEVMENMSNAAAVDVSVLPEIPQIISSIAGYCTKESQESPDNFDATENIPNDAFVDISILPDVPQMISSTVGNSTKELCGTPDNLDVMVNISIEMDDTHEAPQMISSKEEDGTHNLSSPKPCEVLNEDGNEKVDDLLNGNSSAPDVAKPTEHKGIKPISQHKGSQVHDKGPRETASKRNAGSSSKKKQNKSSGPSDISDLKFCQRKRKRMRRLSELIETDQTGVPTNSIVVDHARTNDICEIDKGKFSSEIEKDTGFVVSNEREDEIQSRTVQNKTKLRVDDVDDRSSLMNWLKRTHKKVRSEKKDSGHRNVDPSAVSISTPGISASKKLHQDLGPSVGDQNQEEDPATTNVNHGSKNKQNNCRGLNVLQTHDLCHHEPSNSRQGSLGNSTILLKRKVPSADNAKHSGIKSGSHIVKKNRLKVDDKGQMASENSQKRLTKVSFGKGDTHNVSGTPDQKMATNKQQKLQQDIAKWSEHCGAHTGYRQGVSKGVPPFDTNRKENCEALNSAMLSARWNALQLSSVSSSASTEYSSPRYREAQSWTRGKGKVVHPLDKLVKKDICQTNRNPADFTVISDNNEYMRSC
ncbi:hypothetical protein QOZ80_1AG0000860 [Eleusine coracana subsp. coracana]|nr:hypothetical protein QOZ80_1AG0000860 [Eleusine coracana subsp. coracana]